MTGRVRGMKTSAAGKGWAAMLPGFRVEQALRLRFSKYTIAESSRWFHDSGHQTSDDHCRRIRRPRAGAHWLAHGHARLSGAPSPHHGRRRTAERPRFVVHAHDRTVRRIAPRARQRRGGTPERLGVPQVVGGPSIGTANDHGADVLLEARCRGGLDGDVPRGARAGEGSGAAAPRCVRVSGSLWRLGRQPEARGSGGRLATSVALVHAAKGGGTL